MSAHRWSLMAALALLASLVCAQDTADPLAKGEERYRLGDFEGAVAAYREALASGLDGARVQYNLGNALYRAGKPGEAIAHWLAARTLAPRDADIRANLQRALLERPQGPPAPSPSWLHALVSWAIDALTLSELAGAAAVLYWLAVVVGIALLVRLRPSRSLRRALIALAVLAGITTALGIGRWWCYHQVRRAVVVAESTTINTGPGESFGAAQTVSEGCILRIVGEDSGWTKVVAEGGARGWVRDEAVARVPGPGVPEELAGSE